MKKTITLFIVFLFSLGLSGCVSMPLKQYVEVLPKASSIHLEKAKFCKLREINLGSKLSFEEPIDNPSAEQLEVLDVYGVSLKEELEKRGFTVVDDFSKEGTLIVKTKVGEIPVSLLRYPGVGVIAVELEVLDNSGKPLLSFQKGGNTTFLLKAKKQIKLVAPWVAEQLKKKFL